MAQSKKVKRKPTRGFFWKMKITFYLACAAGLLLLFNLAYQVIHKPSEIIGVIDHKFHKSPVETWQAYGETFKEKSTTIMTADLLAALAQAESNGNPIIRTYWKWKLTTNLKQIYAPASSSVGMFQITRGTFDEAKQFCIKDKEVYRQVPGSSNGPCSNNFAYNRLIPSHAIEMTSSRLHFFAQQILMHRPRQKATLRDRQSLATIIHLCGVAKGETFARVHFNAHRLGHCGDHDPAAYLRRIKTLQVRFQKMLTNERLAAN